MANLWDKQDDWINQPVNWNQQTCKKKSKDIGPIQVNVVDSVCD
jgi:hypothetical protein